MEFELSLLHSQEPTKGLYYYINQSSLHPFQYQSNHQCLDLPNGFFLSPFPIRVFYACYMLAHHILLDLITLIIFCEEYKLYYSSPRT